MDTETCGAGQGAARTLADDATVDMWSNKRLGLSVVVLDSGQVHVTADTPGEGGVQAGFVVTLDEWRLLLDRWCNQLRAVEDVEAVRP
jgi:hypothetical protein